MWKLKGMQKENEEWTTKIERKLQTFLFQKGNTENYTGSATDCRSWRLHWNWWKDCIRTLPQTLERLGEHCKTKKALLLWVETMLWAFLIGAQVPIRCKNMTTQPQFWGKIETGRDAGTTFRIHPKQAVVTPYQMGCLVTLVITN